MPLRLLKSLNIFLSIEEATSIQYQSSVYEMLERADFTHAFYSCRFPLHGLVEQEFWE